MWLVWLILLLLILTEAGAELSLKQWAKTNKNYFVGIGILLYIVVSLLFAYVNKHSSNLVQINTLWQVGNIIVIAAIGVILYKESISPKQTLAIVLAVISTLLMA